ncbi:MAG TPA: hypothetical protein DIS73_00545 [Planctomycetia bacterium]|nr:hypothetical protein [Planctomycetia bacterium]
MNALSTFVIVLIVGVGLIIAGGLLVMRRRREEEQQRERHGRIK